MTYYRTVETCTEPECRCDDRHGVILYDGPDRDEAERAKELARYDEVHIEERELKGSGR